MAHTLSAKKRIRQSVKRNLANKTVKSSIRTMEKKIRKLVHEKKVDDAAAELKNYSSAMDKAGRKYTIHPNTVSRKKSRLAQLIKKASGQTGSAAAPAPATPVAEAAPTATSEETTTE